MRRAAPLQTVSHGLGDRPQYHSAQIEVEAKGKIGIGVRSCPCHNIFAVSTARRRLLSSLKERRNFLRAGGLSLKASSCTYIGGTPQTAISWYYSTIQSRKMSENSNNNDPCVRKPQVKQSAMAQSDGVFPRWQSQGGNLSLIFAQLCWIIGRCRHSSLFRVLNVFLDSVFRRVSPRT